jgi:ATP-dependent Clp protease ATP-binding subunit ClpB
MQVDEVAKRLHHKDITLTVDALVYDYLAKEGYDPKFGARPLKRLIQSKILTPVASMMVGQGMLRGGTVHVTMKKDELSFEVHKKSLRSSLAKSSKKIATAG